jgi:hypothetical protein
MMSVRRGNLARAIFIPFAGTTAATLLTAPYLIAETQSAQSQSARQLESERLAGERGSQWSDLSASADEAENLLRRHERGRGRGQGRGNRRRPYVLGMTGSGTVGEAQLFEIMTYFEKVGNDIAMGQVDARRLAVYLREDIHRWQALLTDLRARGDAPLDGNRYEQLTHAIAALDLLAAGDSEYRTALATWRPLRLVHGQLFAEGARETVVRATIQNDNAVASPVPVLRVEFQTHDGVRIGSWLLFPSDAEVPPLGEIEIRGRLEWPTEGVPSVVGLLAEALDYDEVRSATHRFPGPGGETWRD